MTTKKTHIKIVTFMRLCLCLCRFLSCTPNKNQFTGNVPHANICFANVISWRKKTSMTFFSLSWTEYKMSANSKIRQKEQPKPEKRKRRKTFIFERFSFDFNWLRIHRALFLCMKQHFEWSKQLHWHRRYRIAFDRLHFIKWIFRLLLSFLWLWCVENYFR